MVEPIFDYQFRLILIGDSVVGKSSLLKFFTDGKFAEVCTGNPNPKSPKRKQSCQRSPTNSIWSLRLLR